MNISDLVEKSVKEIEALGRNDWANMLRGLKNINTDLIEENRWLKKRVHELERNNEILATHYFY